MLISILFVILWTFGGAAVTYVVFRDRPFIWRLAVGNIIGSAVAGTTLFLLTFAAGLSMASALAALIAAVLPSLAFIRSDLRSGLARDWASAKGKMNDGAKRFGGAAFYAFWLILFCLFFSQAMWTTDAGIFTGGSQNLGDLPFHLGAIFSFTDGGNFPPQNPSFAGAKFSYPFVADLLTAMFMRLGANLKGAMFVQNVAWAFSLLVLLEAFVARLAGSRLAGRLAAFLLFFSGGLGFLWFLNDHWHQSKGLIDHLWALPQDYTIGEKFRWGNSLVVLFITQRSLLLGMPLTIAVLAWIWKTFTAEPKDAESRPEYPWWLAPLVIGLLAGTLPLIHLHSLFVLFVVTGSCFVLRPDRWREWLAFGIGVCVVALPELAWSMTGSASKVSEFIGYKFGWDMPSDKAMPYWQMPFWLIVFWIKNAGLTLPMIVAGIYLLLRARKNEIAPAAADDLKESKAAVKAKDSRKAAVAQVAPSALLYFYVPFIFLFAVSNAMKLAPWEWDNIKVLIYWFVGSLPIIAYALVRLWQMNAAGKAAAGVIFVTLIAAGSLDVFRTVSSQNRIKVFDTDAIRLAEQIKGKTPPNALFLNAPTYNSAVVLSGRRSFMRYSGHLSSHGIDYLPRERDVKTIYEGGGVADILLKENGIDYVLVSPAETGDLDANEAYFRKFPLIAESGPYRVYQVR